MVRFFRSFAIAMAFLTRLPIPAGDVQPGDLGRSLIWFPAVGGALGLSLVGADWLIQGRFSSSLVAVALVALLIVLTGGLHIDGVADVFDGLAGGRGNRDRVLAIMRDSRIGSMGGAAMVLVLLAKVFALSDLLGTDGRQAWVLAAFPLVARWTVLALIVFFPGARQEGLGATFHQEGRALYLGLATIFIAGSALFIGPQIAFPAAISLLVTLAVGVWLYRRLGGLTGDVYGAAIELAELAFIVAATRHV